MTLLRHPAQSLAVRTSQNGMWLRLLWLLCVIHVAERTGAEETAATDPEVHLWILHARPVGREQDSLWNSSSQLLSSNLYRLDRSQYVMVYSPSVWTEHPNQVSFTLRTKVFDFQMTESFDRALSEQMPCVHMILEEAGGTEALYAEHCGFQEFDTVIHDLWSADDVVGLSAEVYDSQRTKIAHSLPLLLKKRQFGSWHPPRPPAGQTLTQQCGALQSALIASFVATGEDAEELLAGLDNWAWSLGPARGCGGQVHLFVASDAHPAVMQRILSAAQQLLGARLHTLSARWYECFLQQESSTCSSSHSDHHLPWPASLQRARKAFFLGRNLVLHPATHDADAIMVIDPRMRFAGPVLWDSVHSALAAPLRVATVRADGARGPSRLVQEQRAGDSLFQRALAYWQARRCAGEASEEGARSVPALSGALSRNTVLLQAAGEPLAEESESLPLCSSAERALLWNRELHLGEIHLYRPRVFRSSGYLDFLRGLDAEDGVWEWGWTWTGLATLWALAEVAESEMAELSWAVPVREYQLFDDATAAYPLNRALRPVHDVLSEAQGEPLVPPPPPSQHASRSAPIRIVAVAGVEDGAAEGWAVPEGQRAWACGRLDDDAWRACSREGGRRVRGAGIAMVRGAFVEGNSRHPAVYGTVYDPARVFLHQMYVTPPCNWYQSRHHLLISRVRRLIVASNVAFPTSYGHMLHELLPRLIWLASEVDADVPMLVVTSPVLLQAIDLLHASGVPLPRSRVLSWEMRGVLYGSDHALPDEPEQCHWLGPPRVRSMTVVAAEELYFYFEFPFVRSRQVTVSGRSSYHPPSLLRMVRRRFELLPALATPSPAAPLLQPPASPHLLLIKRPPPPAVRSLRNHQEVLSILRGGVAGEVVEHSGDESLEQQVALFGAASAVVGPHGAAFSNLLFCQPRTRVVEIGWGQTASSPAAAATDERDHLSDIFFELATALGLDYWLVLARSGGQHTQLDVDPQLVLDALLGNGGPPAIP